LLNDPKIRTRLSGYKVMADRDDRNMRDYQSFKMITGGGYHPTTAKFLASTYETNAKIATAEMAVGGAVDAATNVVNSIIDEQNRKQEERNAQYKQEEANARAKKDAIDKWEKNIADKRNKYETNVSETIKKNYQLVATIPDLPITYETEEYIKGDSYWKGNRMYHTSPTFKKVTKTMKDWGNAKTYNLYIVEHEGLFGILGDDGEALYPPQFGGIYVLQNVHERPHILVNIEDKWGEILADGSIAEEVKYDGIWYSPDKQDKILRYGNQWIIKSLKDNTTLKELNTHQIDAAYPAGLIPVINALKKNYNGSGNYSLTANGKMYVWGKTTEEGIGSIPYESAKTGETTERLFNLDGKWYISTGFGTKSMKVESMPPKFVVPVLRETGSGKKWGAINERGETVIPFEYSYMETGRQGISTNKGNFFGPQYQTKWLTEKRKYYSNGQLKSQAWFNNDKLEGEALLYYENGNLKYKWHFINGLQAGEKQEAYREDGTLQAIEDWKDDNKNGKATYYFESGELGEEGQYQNGKKTGEWKTYYRSGKLYKTGRYDNDLETGVWKIFNEDGSAKTTITYENGGITNITEH